MPGVKGNNEMELNLLAHVAAPAAMAASGIGYLCMAGWPKFKIWRAWHKVRRTYGVVVANRFSAEQLMTLAKYNGPKPPDLVTQHDLEKNRWEPQSEQEARDIVSGIVFREQMERLQSNPEATGRVTYGDAGPPPLTADGRRVDYHMPRRRPLTLSPAYFTTLARNQIQMDVVTRAAMPDARPAIAWTKPDHMTIHEGDYEPLAVPMIEGPSDQSLPSQIRWDGNCYMKDGAPCRRQSECREHGECTIAIKGHD